MGDTANAHSDSLEDNDTALEDNDTALEDNDTALEDNDTALEDNDTALEDNDTALERAEESVDKATIQVIDCSNDISRDICELQQKTSNLYSTIIDHLDTKIETSIAAELHKIRIKDCEIASSVLKSVSKHNAELITEYLNRMEHENQGSEKQLSMKEKEVEDTIENIRMCQKEIQLLTERFDAHLKNERLAKIELRRTQKHFDQVKRERNQAYLDRTTKELLYEEVTTQKTVVYQKSISWKIIILILIFLLLLSLVHFAIGLPNLTVTIDTSLAVLGVVVQMVATTIVTVDWPKVKSRIKSWRIWRIRTK